MRNEHMDKQKEVILSIKCIKIAVQEMPKLDYKILINGQSV